MSEMYVTIDVFYEESDLPVFEKHKIKNFEPLADPNIENFEERINKTLGNLENHDRGPAKYRMEVLSKIYRDYLIADKIEMVTPFHHRFVFTCGSSGIEFAQEFCFMMFAFGPTEARAKISSFDYFCDEDGREYEMELTIRNDDVWRKVYIDSA